MIRRIISWSPILVGLILALTLGLLQSPAQAGGEKPTPSASIVPGASETGYWYQVKPGDSWRSVSQATGVPARELRKANLQGAPQCSISVTSSGFRPGRLHVWTAHGPEISRIYP